MLYTFSKEEELKTLPPIPGLKIVEVDDPFLISLLNQITLEEAIGRFENDHKAYVAYLDNVPAAFGWMAMREAKIGELNHEFILPAGHRYLWNFRTIYEFRGMGIYPRLLQYILRDQKNKSERFWIMHAPENASSEKGILKAGFNFIGKVTVKNDHPVISGLENNKGKSDEIFDTFGFLNSSDNEPPCWNCSSPYIRARNKDCCCKAKYISCVKIFI